jgi:hypothetical protein
MLLYTEIHPPRHACRWKRIIQTGRWCVPCGAFWLRAERSGKSTLPRSLAAITGLPLIQLDHAYWAPGWRAPAREGWQQTVAALCGQPAWVMDGNYSGTLD